MAMQLALDGPEEEVWAEAVGARASPTRLAAEMDDEREGVPGYGGRVDTDEVVLGLLACLSRGMFDFQLAIDHPLLVLALSLSAAWRLRMASARASARAFARRARQRAQAHRHVSMRSTVAA
jgi:hypothetical protein